MIKRLVCVDALIDLIKEQIREETNGGFQSEISVLCGSGNLQIVMKNIEKSKNHVNY